MFSLFNTNPELPQQMGMGFSGSLSLSGDNETDPLKRQAEEYDLKTGEKKTEDVNKKGLNQAFQADQEQLLANKERNSTIAKGLGILATVATTTGMVADSIDRNTPKAAQSRIRVSTPKGGSSSNLLGGGGVERYLRPISGRGKKIQGYFR